MELGKIQYVDDIRSVWANEAKDFTPWLAENIDLLAEQLGLDLELVKTEHEVGSFSLDILARDLSTGHNVVIENQLESTDHTHLGQLLTYASGLDAKIIIWISKVMREEHLKALEWLNEISSEEIKFFGVEVQVIQINDSIPAPLFKVRVSPNEWFRTQKQKVNNYTSPKGEYYRDFFSKALDKIHEEMPGFTGRKNADQRSYLEVAKVNKGYFYLLTFTQGKFACMFYIDFTDKDVNKQRFDELFIHKNEIEKVLGELSWERREDSIKHSRISSYRDIGDDAEMISWGIQKLTDFRSVFEKYI